MHVSVSGELSVHDMGCSESPTHALHVVVPAGLTGHLWFHVRRACMCAMKLKIECWCNTMVKCTRGHLYFAPSLRGELYDCRFNGSCFPLGEKLTLTLTLGGSYINRLPRKDLVHHQSVTNRLPIAPSLSTETTVVLYQIFPCASCARA